MNKPLDKASVKKLKELAAIIENKVKPLVQQGNDLNKKLIIEPLAERAIGNIDNVRRKVNGEPEQEIEYKHFYPSAALQKQRLSNIFKSWEKVVSDRNLDYPRLAAKYEDNPLALTDEQAMRLGKYVKEDIADNKMRANNNALAEQRNQLLRNAFSNWHDYTAFNQMGRNENEYDKRPLIPEVNLFPPDDLEPDEYITLAAQRNKDMIRGDIDKDMTIADVQSNLHINPSEEEAEYNAAYDKLQEIHTRLNGYLEAFDMAVKKAESILSDDDIADEDKVNAVLEPINELKPLLFEYNKIPIPNMSESLKSMHERFVNLEKLRQTAETIGLSEGLIKQLLRDYNAINSTLKQRAPEILDQLQTYVDMTNNQKAVENQIKALATYESFLSLPPAAFDNLPESIKKKCIQLMTLKNHLQKVYGMKKKISKKYKLNAGNTPISSNESTAKVLNPMLNRGYRLFDKVSAQQSAYNKNFN